MKKITLLLAITLVAHLAIGQIDRTQKPAPAPAKEFKIGEYEKFTLSNGLTVIVVENRKLPRVAFSLIIDRDPILEKNKVGYAAMAGQILRNGTTTRSKAQLDEEVDFIGANLSTSSVSIYGSSLTKHREKMLDLFEDVLYNPSFPQEELDKIKKQTISGLKSNQEDPGAISANVRAQLLYGENHPYGEIQLEEHVEAITIEDLKNYYTTYFKPNISYLAIVGDITLKEAKKITKKRFGKWEAGEVPKSDYQTPQWPEENTIALVNRSNAVQTVLNIGYPINLKPGSMAYLKARVMNQVLGGGSAGRLFKNIREDKGYTYGAYSSISSDELVGNFNAGASVRTEVTDSAIVAFLYEMTKITSEEVPEEELQLAKNVITGGFGRSLESPQTIARFAINIERYQLPEDYYNNYVKNIQAVTTQDVLAIAKQYIRPENTYILAVGKTNQLAEKLKKFGKTIHLDVNGKEVDPSLTKVPDGLTATSVIEKYIEAIGGREKIEALKSVKMKMSTSVMGQEMQMNWVKTKPDKFLMEVSMGGNVVQKQVFNGEKGKMLGMAGTQTIEGDKALDMSVSAAMIEELAILEKGLKTKLIAVEDINGKDAYAIELTMPSGQVTTRYYDIDTGYLMRVVNQLASSEGSVALNMDFDDYQLFEGIRFPTSIKQPINPQLKMDVKVEEVLINAEVDLSSFQIE
ncbi:MAG: pitrilysin family protein [Bacteroidota bacterium]